MLQKTLRGAYTLAATPKVATPFVALLCRSVVSVVPSLAQHGISRSIRGFGPISAPSNGSSTLSQSHPLGCQCGSHSTHLLVVGRRYLSSAADSDKETKEVPMGVHERFGDILKTEPVRVLKPGEKVLQPDEEDESIFHHNEDLFDESKKASRPSDGNVPLGQIDPRMVIAFTCEVCEARLVKTMSKKSYTTGVVIVRCDGCKGNHLIADHLGWFDDNSITIEDILKEKGDTPKKLAVDEHGSLDDEGLKVLQDTIARAREEDLNAPIGGVHALKQLETETLKKQNNTADENLTSQSYTALGNGSAVPENNIQSKPS